MKKKLIALCHRIFPPKEKIEFSIGIYTGENPFQMKPYGNNPVLKTANVFQIGIYALLKIISKITIHIKMRNKLSNYIFFIAEKR